MSKSKYGKKFKKRCKPLEIGGNTFRIQNGKVVLTKRGGSLKPQHLIQVNAYAKKHSVRSFSQFSATERTSYPLEDFNFYSDLENREDEKDFEDFKNLEYS